MRASIAAEPERVWRALTTPSEVVEWNEGMIAAIDPPTDYPSCAQTMRWRYRLGGVQLVLHDTPREVVPHRRLHTTRSVGSMRYDETYSLAREETGPDSPPATQLAIKVTAANSVPVVGGTLIDRFEIRRMATERVNETIRALQRFCERD